MDGELIGNSPPIRNIRELIKVVTDTGLSVIIARALDIAGGDKVKAAKIL